MVRAVCFWCRGVAVKCVNFISDWHVAIAEDETSRSRGVNEFFDWHAAGMKAGSVNLYCDCPVFGGEVGLGLSGEWRGPRAGESGRRGGNGERCEGAASGKGAEGLKLVGVSGPELNEGFEGGEGLGLEVMFDSLHFLSDGFWAEAELGEKPGQDLVTGSDSFGHSPAVGCESETSVTLVVYKTASREPPDHVGNSGDTQPQRFGDVGHPGIAFGFDQFIDALEVIFGGFGPILRAGARI